eukprot:scaffold15340_cov30-Tisochrysis_lutea.AAC.1
MSDAPKKRPREPCPSRVLVVGSINVDLYQRTVGGTVRLAGQKVDLSPVKGMTLPASSLVQKLSSQLFPQPDDGAEALVLQMEGPFEQKTGGKGANSAAAAGQTFRCELFARLGETSAEQNKQLLADLHQFGQVDTARCATLPRCPTGTAYILLFDDNDNAIVLIGGANQSWPPAQELEASDELHEAIDSCVVLMLQREVPEYVNVVAARLARAMGKPVFMDVGGTDAPLDTQLIPYISIISPNESELTFLSGVATEENDSVSRPLLRRAVSMLKSKFAAAGNTDIEVLVTLGAKGSLHFGSQWSAAENDFANEVWLPHETHIGIYNLASPNGRPVDTTGAGDCFRGSFVGAHYGEGKSLTEAMKWASAAGSLSVEVEGAMLSMPDRLKIEARIAEPLLDVSFS